MKRTFRTLMAILACSLVSLSTFANTPIIESFVVAGVSATIDHETESITAEMPMGFELREATPTVTLGGSAIDYDPKGVQNFEMGYVAYSATDGTKTKTYQVLLTRRTSISTDASLSDIKLNGVTLEGFDPSTTYYEVEISINASVPVVAATATDSYASVEITQASSIDDVANIKVTAENGTIKNYMIVLVPIEDESALESTTLLGISYNNGIIYNPNKQNLQVIDVYGKVVRVSDTDIDLSTQINGVYLIRNQAGCIKIIK